MSLRSCHFQLPIMTPTYLTLVRDQWCVCTWLVTNMYVSDDVVMNVTLMPLGPYCSCLKFHVKLSATYFTLVHDLWCVCTWLMIHMYVSDDVVMEGTLMHLLKPLGPYCESFVQIWVLPTFLLYMTYDVFVSDLWCTCTWAMTRDTVMNATLMHLLTNALGASQMNHVIPVWSFTYKVMVPEYDKNLWVFTTLMLELRCKLQMIKFLLSFLMQFAYGLTG